MSSAGPSVIPRQPDSSATSLPRWIFPEPNPSAVTALTQDAGLPRVIAELLVDRGVHAAAEAERFLNPRIDDLLDPYTMLGMREAVIRIQAAVERREPILICGDYDVDGTTAVVLLKTAIEILGGEVRFHVPHRIRDGYGMQPEVLDAAADEGVRLVISVDNGIRAFAAAEAAERLSLDLIITDHHLPEASAAVPSEKLPRALAILNPNQSGCAYASKDLCGAGLAFKLSQALLEAHDYERARGRILPSFLKMLAIATVADAVPLRGENRVLLSLGLEQLRRPVNPGLCHLIELAGLDPSRRRLTAGEIAFRIAPRINAAGRMDVASDVVEMFTTRDPLKAREIAAKLDRLNGERRQAEASALEEIEERFKQDEDLSRARLIVMGGEGWHRGIIGILASRIVDRRRRPAIVVALENGEAYGSGRSIPGFHLLEAIESCRELFTRFGGHAHAVGFSLPSERLPELRRRLESWAEDRGPVEPPGLGCHAVLPFEEITPTLFSWLRRLEPMGIGNEEPVFAAYGVRVTTAPKILKDRHIRSQLAQGPRSSFPAVGWNWAERAQALGVKENSIVDVAYRLKENSHPDFGGLELEIVDLAPRADPNP